jgi:hypothetical protein
MNDVKIATPIIATKIINGYGFLTSATNGARQAYK